LEACANRSATGAANTGADTAQNRVVKARRVKFLLRKRMSSSPCVVGTLKIRCCYEQMHINLKSQDTNLHSATMLELLRINLTVDFCLITCN
jgi:hypothetical protein